MGTHPIFESDFDCLTDQCCMSQVAPSEKMSDDGSQGLCGSCLIGASYLCSCIFFPCGLCAGIKIVQEYERAVIFRLGKLHNREGAVGPGLFCILPCTDTYIKVDMRTVSFDIPPQEILTKDSVTIAVDAVVYYKISNANASVQNVEDASASTRMLAQTTLRNILGTRTLSGILSEREEIAEEMLKILDEATDPWGITVERVEVKAAREAKAKIIAAEGEMNASKNLKEAADTIASSPAALQLRYLQTLTAISAEKNSTIVFPIPMD